MARFPEIPLEHRAGLQKLATFDEAQLSQLEARLRSAPLRIDRDEFVKGIGPVDRVDELALQEALGALMFLSVFLAPTLPDIPLNSIVTDITDSLRASGFDDAAQLVRLQSTLTRLLALDAIAARAKALDLQVDHANVFQGVRVLTDIRPVFSPDSLRVSGLLVVHTLKIEYFDREPQEIFIAMDERDVSAVKDAFSRAELKAEAIKSQLIDTIGTSDFGTVALGKDKP